MQVIIDYAGPVLPIVNHLIPIWLELHAQHLLLQVFDLYHFTDELTKDMREGRGWYAGWDVGRRLLFIILFYAGINFESSLVSVSNNSLIFLPEGFD